MAEGELVVRRLICMECRAALRLTSRPAPIGLATIRAFNCPACGAIGLRPLLPSGDIVEVTADEAVSRRRDE